MLHCICLVKLNVSYKQMSYFFVQVDRFKVEVEFEHWNTMFFYAASQHGSCHYITELAVFI